jgi:hypothetical protein
LDKPSDFGRGKGLEVENAVRRDTGAELYTTVALCGPAFYLLLRAIKLNEEFTMTLQGRERCSKGSGRAGEKSREEARPRIFYAERFFLLPACFVPDAYSSTA